MNASTNGGREIMLEETIANYIAGNTSLVTGTDIFLHSFPEGFEEGVIVRCGNEVASFEPLRNNSTRLLIFYRDYIDSRNIVEVLMVLLNSKRGTLDGTWTITGELNTEELGEDQEGRFGFSIELSLSYDYSTIYNDYLTIGGETVTLNGENIYL